MLNNYIYFISELGTSRIRGTKCVKIGVAANPMIRMAELQTGNPRVLELAVTFGSMSRKEAFALEEKLHHRFRKSRLAGEWFMKKVLASLQDIRDMRFTGEATIYPTRSGYRGIEGANLISDEQDMLRRFEMKIVVDAKAAGL